MLAWPGESPGNALGGAKSYNWRMAYLQSVQETVISAMIYQLNADLMRPAVGKPNRELTRFERWAVKWLRIPYTRIRFKPRNYYIVYPKMKGIAYNISV